MSRLNFISLFSVTALSLGLSISASATTVTIGATAPAGYTATTFGAGNTTSGAGSWIFAGGASTQNATTAACIDPGASGYFGCATAQSSITANFASGITGLDFVWGSPDAYNTLTFYTGLNGTGTAQSFNPGTAPLVVNSAPLAEAGLFVAGAGVTWESVVFSSSFNSYEFASVYSLAASTTTAATPEPASIALLAGGLLALGAGALRRRK